MTYKVIYVKDLADHLHSVILLSLCIKPELTAKNG